MLHSERKEVQVITRADRIQEFGTTLRCVIDYITPVHLKEKSVVYEDDLLIVGTHDTIRELTRKVIKELGEYGIRFSDKKIQYRRNEIDYLGYRITARGIEPLPRHVEAITSLPPPITIRDLRSIIGMANFIRN